MTSRFAVITSGGKRECLRDAILAIHDQVQVIILVHSCPQSDVTRYVPEIHQAPIAFIQYPAEQFNISKAWNMGLDCADKLSYGDPYKVAVLNDDAIAPAGWFDWVATYMDRYKAAAGCSGGPPGNPIIYTKSGPVDPSLTMRGWAFMLDGSKGLRADQTMEYWYSDNDLAWRAADAGGMVMAPQMDVANLYPNGSITPELQVQIAKDAQTFVDKWGTPPW